MNLDDVTRRLVWAAYELGWQDACADHMNQQANPKHPIGQSRAPEVGLVLQALDPTNLLGLR